MTTISRRRWAWLMLPHMCRFELWLAHATPRGSDHRMAWAQYLKTYRKDR